MSETEEYYNYGGNDGGPAFPTTAKGKLPNGAVVEMPWKGMSLRAYAAIHLRVPCSGFDWLDDMIEDARRSNFAGRALSGILADDSCTSPQLLSMHGVPGMTRSDVAAKVAADMARAMTDALDGIDPEVLP